MLWRRGGGDVLVGRERCVVGLWFVGRCVCTGWDLCACLDKPFHLGWSRKTFIVNT